METIRRYAKNIRPLIVLMLIAKVFLFPSLSFAWHGYASATASCADDGTQTISIAVSVPSEWPDYTTVHHPENGTAIAEGQTIDGWTEFSWPTGEKASAHWSVTGGKCQPKYEACSELSDPIYSDWSEWTIDPLTGNETRTREVTSYDKYNSELKCDFKVEKETKEYNVCSVTGDPVYGAWSDWQVQPDGSETRSRSVSYPDKYNAEKICKTDVETEAKVYAVCSVTGDPVYGAWSDWQVQPDGSETRSRSVSYPDKYNAEKICKTDVETEAKVYAVCSVTGDPVYGAWSDWQVQPDGSETRSRSVSYPDKYNAEKICKTDVETEAKVYAVCSVTGDPVYGAWSDWQVQPDGSETRSRSVSYPDKYNAEKICKTDVETEAKVYAVCSVTGDPVYGAWSDWQVQPDGSETRSRSVSYPDKYNAEKICKTDVETEAKVYAVCSVTGDPVYGAWSDWQVQPDGSETRSRSVSYPDKYNAEKICKTDVETEAKVYAVCSVTGDPVYGAWSDWQVQPDGSETRSRSVSYPDKYNAEKICKTDVETEAKVYAVCSVTGDPVYGAWSDWQVQPDGSETRSRSVSYPDKYNAEKICKTDVETEVRDYTECTATAEPVIVVGPWVTAEDGSQSQTTSVTIHDLYDPTKICAVSSSMGYIPPPPGKENPYAGVIKIALEDRDGDGVIDHAYPESGHPFAVSSSDGFVDGNAVRGVTDEHGTFTVLTSSDLYFRDLGSEGTRPVYLPANFNGDFYSLSVSDLTDRDLNQGIFDAAGKDRQFAIVYNLIVNEKPAETVQLKVATEPIITLPTGGGD